MANNAWENITQYITRSNIVSKADIILKNCGIYSTILSNSRICFNGRSFISESWAVWKQATQRILSFKSVQDIFLIRYHLKWWKILLWELSDLLPWYGAQVNIFLPFSLIPLRSIASFILYILPSFILHILPSTLVSKLQYKLLKETFDTQIMRSSVKNTVPETLEHGSFHSFHMKNINNKLKNELVNNLERKETYRMPLTIISFYM